jgi:hypothetical protein
VYSEYTPDDGQRNCPKHVEIYFLAKINLKNSEFVGFIIKKIVTIRGHMNVKEMA